MSNDIYISDLIKYQKLHTNIKFSLSDTEITFDYIHTCVMYMYILHIYIHIIKKYIFYYACICAKSYIVYFLLIFCYIK